MLGYSYLSSLFQLVLVHKGKPTRNALVISVKSIVNLQKNGLPSESATPFIRKNILRSSHVQRIKRDEDVGRRSSQNGRFLGKGTVDKMARNLCECFGLGALTLNRFSRDQPLQYILPRDGSLGRIFPMVGP